MKTQGLTQKELRALIFIRNHLAHSGRQPTIRSLQHHLGYNSPRAASYIIEQLERKGYIDRPSRGSMRVVRDLPFMEDHAQTIEVPIVGRVPCGTPLLAEENLEGAVPVARQLLKPSHSYFMLRASGNSMDLVGIDDGDLLLVQQQPTADDGQIVVAMIDGEATVKQLHRQREYVVLQPRSTDKGHQPILLHEDFRVMGVVTSVIKIKK